ncbi:TPA: hypothetical protein QFP15_000309 [Enterococcus faecium]|uniref:hypothetical protein n=2 Tax=Enterococcus TaxID=1350 RepID=UPI0003179F6F|nr:MULTISPECIES: hypothetical protein [Enterococcus]MCO5441389.1 hypothetical protein [Enterococcus faecium]OAQ45029.1 hypothetical protein A5489_06525 [Enterococcus faecium]OFQ01755.1 hypothetical protein HMPREF2961_05985 [Enterococcus sp. HMSC076E04]UBX36802.1 hypothetical protein K9N64_13760 [Enterococcus lactis]WPL32033.1 hypothetical protein QE259_05175 [Enterococcus lactis]
MQKKISIIITLFFICILASWFIQRQAALYDVPVIEIERVRIEEDQQLITGRLMNTDQKGEVISLSAPYQKNQIETANITTRQIYLVQMHGDEWQLVAKKMMAGFFSLQVSSLAPCCLLVENRVYLLWEVSSSTSFYFYFCCSSLPKQKVFLS